MNFNKSKGLALLPEKMPSNELLGSILYDFRLKEELENMEEAKRRAVLWTIALEQVFFRESDIWRKVTGYRFATCGFADPEIEGDAFGIMVYACPHIEFAKSGQQIFEMKVSGYDFPIFLRFAFEVFHGLPDVHPLYGTSACWARSEKLALNGKLGFLTAKHVLGSFQYPDYIGTQIGTIKESGIHGPGTLLDLGPEGIDAALIEPPSDVSPIWSSNLRCPQFIAQWTDVSFRGLRSGSVQTKVVEVQLGRGVLHPSIPLRIFLAHPGQPGDSGSLVLDSNGNGIGIYMSGLVNLAGHMEGCCQHLAQVTHVMNLTPLI